MTEVAGTRHAEKRDDEFDADVSTRTLAGAMLEAGHIQNPTQGRGGKGEFQHEVLSAHCITFVCSRRMD